MYLKPQLIGAPSGAEGLCLEIVYFIDIVFFLYRLIEVMWALSQNIELYVLCIYNAMNHMYSSASELIF